MSRRSFGNSAPLAGGWGDACHEDTALFPLTPIYKAQNLLFVTLAGERFETLPHKYPTSTSARSSSREE